MNFNRFLTDKVALVKTTGEQHNNLKAQVSSKGILMQGNIVISVGDQIIRYMSNGAEETYSVTDPKFQEKIASMPAHYNLQVTKQGVPTESPTQNQVINTTYNFNGDNSRVNNNSIDNSVNNTVVETNNYIEQLRDEINRVIELEETKVETLGVVDVIEQQLSSENPNKTVIQSMVNSLPSLGSLASIGSLIIATLAN